MDVYVLQPHVDPDTPDDELGTIDIIIDLDAPGSAAALLAGDAYAGRALLTINAAGSARTPTSTPIIGSSWRYIARRRYDGRWMLSSLPNLIAYMSRRGQPTPIELDPLVRR